MNFLALLVALGVERLWSARLHVREPAWLGAYARGALRWAGGFGGELRVAAVVAAAVAPGLAAALAIGASAGALGGLVWLGLAGVALFFALGPRDLDREVEEWRAARAAGDLAAASGLEQEILEYDAAQRRGPALPSVADAVFVQANNRLFGVVFWFALLGPFGALLFRFGDLLRREALLAAPAVAPALVPAVAPLEGAPAPPESSSRAHALADDCQRLHGVLAWAPARLLALTYGVAGSFEESFAGWRAYVRAESGHFFDANDRLLVHAGRGALGTRWTDAPDDVERAARALRLVRHAFWAWLAALAALTLVAWLG